MHVSVRRFVSLSAGLASAVLAAGILSACGAGGGTGSMVPAAGGNVSHLASITSATPTFGVTDANSAWIGAAPLTVAWPKGAPSSGDLLVGCAESNHADALQTPAGWTSLFASSSAKGTALFYKIAGTGEATGVVFASAKPYNIGAAIVRISGAAATAPLWSHAASSQAASITTPAIVPNVLGMLPVACFAGSDGGAFSVASGWTSAASEAQYYPALVEERPATTTDLSTGVSVTSALAAPAFATADAYGLLVAPATGATPTPIQTPTPPPPPPGSPAIVDASSSWHYTSPVTLTWSKGVPASGDLLVACVEGQYQTATQTPTGWTALYTADAAFGTALFYKIAGSSEPTSVAFSIAAPYNISAAMARITGAAPVAPQWSHTANFGTGSITTQPIVPGVAGALPLACFGGINAGAYSIASGWTLGAQNTTQYSTMIEGRQSPASDTSTAISVATTGSTASSTTYIDAYGIIVAPNSGVAPAGGVGLNPGSIGFASTTAAAQTVTATQTGNTAFSVTSQNCSGVATMTAQGNGAFSVAPVGVGSCTFTIAGSGGKTAALPVTTTSTVITIH